MKPLHPVEYEIFHALARLKERGQTKASFSNVFREVNRKRRQDGEKSLSRPAMAYHITKLSQRDFVHKDDEKSPHYPDYSLVEGLYKLPCWPLLCIHITESHVFVVICEEVKTCHLAPYTKGCTQLEKILNPPPAPTT